MTCLKGSHHIRAGSAFVVLRANLNHQDGTFRADESEGLSLCSGQRAPA